MAFYTRFLPLVLLLVSSTLAQYEDYHGFEGYNFKQHEPLHHQTLDEHHEEYDVDYHAHPKYSFDYSVKDPHTGDNKEHWETRDGDKVKGSYTLTETDGTKRVVEYEADDKNGFNAVVHKIGTPKEEVKHVYAPPVHHQHDFQNDFQHDFQNDFQQFDEGFVPKVGGYEH